MDKDEINKLSKQVSKHKILLPDSEYSDIDGIPKRIERSDDKNQIEREVRKLERIARDNDDRTLLDITKKMKQNL